MHRNCLKTVVFCVTNWILCVLIAPQQPVKADQTPPNRVSSTDNSDKDLTELKEFLDTPVEVWLATKTKKSMEEAPATVFVITRLDIHKWGYQSVSEILQHVVGFYVIDDHIIPNVAVRGVAGGLFGESGTLKVMIDGQSVAFRATAGNWLGTELIPFSSVERIEILRGPASALYGADAFLGVINIVTRPGKEINGANIRSHLTLTSTKTSDHMSAGHDLSIGVQRGSLDIMVSARITNEDRAGLSMPASSPKTSIPSYNQDAPAASGLDLHSKVGLLKLVYHINDDSKVSLWGYLSQLERVADFSPWAQLTKGLDEQGRMRETRISLYQGWTALKAETMLKSDLELSLNATYFFGGPTNRDRVEILSDVSHIKRELSYRGVESTLEGRWRFLPTVSLVGGVEIMNHHQDLPSSLHVLNFDSGALKAGDIIESYSVRQGHKAFNNLAGYIQAQWNPLGKYLDLTGGVRYDHHSIYGSQLSGRMVAVSNPMEKLYTKLLYGYAFKAPAPLLLYAVPFTTGDVIGNPDLDPQHVHTIETQVIYRPWKYLSVSTGLAYNFLKNKAEFIQQGVNRIAWNLAEVEGLSSETEVNFSYLDWVNAYFNMEYQLTKRNPGQEGYAAYLVGRDNVIYAPYIFRAGVRGQAPDFPVGYSLEGSYVGPRRASDMNILENGASYELSPYFMLGASLSTHALKLFSQHETIITLIGRNLLGTEEPDPGYVGIDYPMAPRTFLLQIHQEL